MLRARTISFALTRPFMCARSHSRAHHTRQWWFFFHGAKFLQDIIDKLTTQFNYFKKMIEEKTHQLTNNFRQLWPFSTTNKSHSPNKTKTDNILNHHTTINNKTKQKTLTYYPPRLIVWTSQIDVISIETTSKKFITLSLHLCFLLDFWAASRDSVQNQTE